MAGLISRLGASLQRVLTFRASAAYNGAGASRRLGNWRPGSGGPNLVVAANAGELRNRTRYLVCNNPAARRAVDLLVAHIVGTGIKPQSLCPDTAFRDAVHRLWADWTDQADADGRLDFYGLQALACREMVEGGECFVRMRPRRPEDGLAVPLQLQLMEAEQCPLEYQVPSGTNPVYQGIERDGLGRRINYWMYRQHPGEMVPGVFDAGMIAPVPADDIAHLYNLGRAGQLRGLPWLASAVATLHQVGIYNDAELARKQVAALFAGFITRRGSEDGASPLLPTTPKAGEPGVGETVIEPGTLQELLEGEDIKFSQPADVGGSYEPFLRWRFREVASLIGVMYEEMTGDYSQVNDRTFRAAFNSFKRSARMWQHDLVAFQFCRPVWTRFIEMALLSGALVRPAGMSDADMMRVRWVPQAWDYIHPLQDVQAKREMVDAGFTSRSAVVSELGEDVEEVDRDIAADQQREESLGLKINQKSGGQGNAGGSALPPNQPNYGMTLADEPAD